MPKVIKGNINDAIDKAMKSLNLENLILGENTQEFKENTRAVKENTGEVEATVKVRQKYSETLKDNNREQKKSNKVNKKPLEQVAQTLRKISDSWSLVKSEVKSNGDILNKYMASNIQTVTTYNKKVLNTTYDLKQLSKELEDIEQNQKETDFSIKQRYGGENVPKSYNKAYSELTKELGNVQSLNERYKDLLNTRAKNKTAIIEKNKALQELNKEYQRGKANLDKAVTQYKDEVQALQGVKHSLKAVSEELQQMYGIDLNSMTKISETNGIQTWVDSYGNIVKLQQRITAGGVPEYAYKVNNSTKELYSSTDKLLKKADSLSQGLKRMRQSDDVKKALEVKQKIDQLGESLTSLKKKIEQADLAEDNITSNKLRQEYYETSKQVDNLTQKLSGMTVEIRNQGSWMLNLKDSFSRAFKSFTTYLSVTTVFYQTARAIRSMVDEVKELDATLTEFKKVSDLSGEALDRYTKKASELGDSVAKTTSEMISAATEFRKSGFGDMDSLELGRIANMYTNIADEELSAAEAASFIIAQMKAFNIEAKDSIKIVDALNEVSNNYAVSSADLAGAIGKVSATMAAGNTSYEQTLGLLTAITEVTRNADKAANALKVIGQRIRGVGEDGEDASEYVASLQNQFDKLGINVKIVKNSAGEMESTYNILQAMAEKWEDLTDAQRQALGEIAAGKNRITELNALMSNWATAADATKTALESEGSAAKENAKVLDSIEGHLKRLQKAWQDLSNTLINSKILKLITDLGTALLKLANTGFGRVSIGATVLFSSIMLISSGLVKFKKYLKESTLEGTNFGKILAYITKGEEGLGRYLYYNEKEYKTYTYREKQARIESEKLRIAKLKEKAAILVTTVAISTAIAIYQAWKNKQEEVIQKEKEFIQLSEDLDSLIQQEKNVQTEEERAEILKQLTKLQKELNEKYRLNITLLKTQDNSKLKQQLELTRQIIDEEKKRKAEEYLKDNSGNVTDNDLTLFAIKNMDAVTAFLDGGFSGWADEIYNRYRTYMDTLTDNIIDSVLLTNDKIANALENFTNQNYRSQDELEKAWKNFIDNYYDIIDKSDLTPDQKEIIEDYTTKVLDNLKESLSKQFKENQFEEAYAAYEKYIKDFAKWANSELTTKEIKELFEVMSGDDGHIDLTKASQHSELAKKFINIDAAAKAAGMTLNEFVERINITDGTIKKTADSFENLVNGLNLLKSALEEQANNSALSADTIWNLVEAGYAAALSFDKETGAVRLDTKALDDLYGAKLRVKSIELQDSINNTIECLKAEATYVAKDIDEWVELVKAKQKAGGNLSDTEQQLLDLYGQKSAVDALITSWSKLKKTVGTSSGSSGKSAWEKSLESLNNQYKNSTITIEQYITKLEALAKKYKKNKTAVKELNEVIRNAKFEKLEDDYKRGLIGVEEYIKGLKELQKAYKENTQEWNKYADSIKKGLEELLGERQTKYKNAQSAAIALLDEEINRIGEIIDAKQKENDETERQIELTKLQEALENARKNRTKRVFREGIGWVYETDHQAIEEAQEALDEFQKEQEILDLQKQKEVLEKYRDSWQSVTDDYEMEQNRLLLIEMMGADAESEILNQRLEVLENFKNEYVAILKDLNMLDKTTADNVSSNGITLNSGGSFANGGVVDYTGYARVHGSANRPEVVLSNSQAASLYTMLNRPQTKSVGLGTGSSSLVYNFDNLVLPNVTNARQFLNELRMVTNITKHQ